MIIDEIKYLKKIYIGKLGRNEIKTLNRKLKNLFKKNCYPKIGRQLSLDNGYVDNVGVIIIIMVPINDHLPLNVQQQQ